MTLSWIEERYRETNMNTRLAQNVSGQSREPSSSTDVLWHFGPGYLPWSTPLFPPALTRCAGDTGGGTMDLGLDPEPWVLFHCLCDHGELFLLSEP